MNGYNFTERVRWALARAREESARLRHEYVGTEHILLGMLRDEESLATHVIESFGVNPNALADSVDGIVKRGQPSGARHGPDLPYTSRAKKILELAMTEARDLNHDYVGTEHLLLGMLREEKGIAAQVLVDAGVTLDASRERILEILGTRQPQGLVARASSISRMKVWDAARTPAADSASGQMAASIIELLAQDAGVGAVFAAQGIDVAKLAAALRTRARAPQADDRANVEPPPSDPPADTPPAA
jgi:ATP-dependent Clp protease ATP-binding subunit ClpA